MSWFSRLFHKFEHVFQHVAAIASDVVAVSFGFPPGAGFAATELLMHAHAGDHHARAKVARLSANPRMRAFLGEVNKHLRAHPHYHHFLSHAAARPAHPAPAPPHGVPSAPLPPGSHAYVADHPHTAGMTTHSTWSGGGAPEVGRAQIVGADPCAAGRAQIVGGDEVGYEDLPLVGHAPHPRGHHHHGHGTQAFGVEWLLGEEDALDHLVGPDDHEPEPWHTPRAPRGTPGV